MRTTLRIDDQLMKRAKQFAATHHCTLTSVVEDALRLKFSSKATRTPIQKIRLTTVKGDGVQPGVDLSHTAQLLDLMDKHGSTRR